jgi:pimeloyl-ACP methyl ester carboxylesterase
LDVVPEVCLFAPLAGGGFFSHKLARALGNDQPFYAVHPHGLIDPGVPESIEAMAAERLPAVRAARPHGPYVLGGHCAGGMVALEIARLLASDGEQVSCVVMIDTVAPQPPKLVFPGISIGAEVQRSRKRLATQAPVDDAPWSAFARYRDAIRRYVPAPYPGRVVVLRPENHPDTRLDWLDGVRSEGADGGRGGRPPFGHHPPHGHHRRAGESLPAAPFLGGSRRRRSSSDSKLTGCR